MRALAFFALAVITWITSRDSASVSGLAEMFTLRAEAAAAAAVVVAFNTSSSLARRSFVCCSCSLRFSSVAAATRLSISATFLASSAHIRSTFCSVCPVGLDGSVLVPEGGARAARGLDPSRLPTAGRPRFSGGASAATFASSLLFGCPAASPARAAAAAADGDMGESARILGNLSILVEPGFARLVDGGLAIDRRARFALRTFCL